MTRTQWEAKVTELVDAEAGPNYGWDDVTKSEWDMLWLKRLSPEGAALALLRETPPATGDSITN